jgi:hypothetical protein
MSAEERAEFPGVLSERHKVNRHAAHKPLDVPKEQVFVYQPVLGGMVQKRSTAKQGS